MRAGQLDRVIVLQEHTRTGTTPAGTAIMDWADVATLRAQLVQANTEEFQRAYGEGANTGVIFRIRWLDEIDVDNRLTYQGRIFNIREITEIGRAKGLELRCEEVRR
jgi:SPP1 family predicted phage head-tail adaptor